MVSADVKHHVYLLWQELLCKASETLKGGRKLIVNNDVTLRASLSGTFLQTLPDLVTPRGQRPPKCLGTNMTVEAT